MRIAITVGEETTEREVAPAVVQAVQVWLMARKVPGSAERAILVACDSAVESFLLSILEEFPTPEITQARETSEELKRGLLGKSAEQPNDLNRR